LESDLQRHANRGVAHVPAVLVLLGVVAGVAEAEEGGSGHYFPGSMASFIDGVSPTQAFIVRLNVLDYDGSFGAGREVPIVGLTAFDADVASRAYARTASDRCCPTFGTSHTAS